MGDRPVAPTNELQQIAPVFRPSTLSPSSSLQTTPTVINIIFENSIFLIS